MDDGPLGVVRGRSCVLFIRGSSALFVVATTWLVCIHALLATTMTAAASRYPRIMFHPALIPLVLLPGVCQLTVNTANYLAFVSGTAWSLFDPLTVDGSPAS